MTEHDWDRINEIFEAVLEVPQEGRRERIRTACDGDEDLEQAVLRLLASDEQAGSFLEKPLSPSVARQGAPSSEGLAVGSRIGSYRLLRALSHGGMGSVYLAERDDDAYRRRVALKLVRAGCATEELLQRFKLERQILAGLEHPYIARLYEGGETEDGRPFLVMEYVEGIPLDRYCDERGLGLEERLDLFQKVCDAVHYAHQNLLVHRDIKPANILVTEGGVPKLLDFGIAKPLAPGPEHAITTVVGLRPMTPGYASPEQVRGEKVTTASDVYALGVLLYRLLTGGGPYCLEGGGIHALERAICEDLPQRPSLRVVAGLHKERGQKERGHGEPGTGKELARRLAGDLDTIVLMALRKEATRRYGSAQQLAADLKRYQRNLPVMARQDTVGYRWGKFLRRNRRLVAVSAAALTALVFMSAFVAVTSARETRRVASEQRKAEQAMDYLLEVFKEADPGQTGRRAVTALELLDEGAEGVGRRFPGNPEMEATVLASIGEAYTSLGYLDRAKPLLERALALRRRGLGEKPGEGQGEVAESLEQLGDLALRRAELESAQGYLEQALELRTSLHGQNSLAQARPRQLLARVLRGQGDLVGAEALQRKVLNRLRRSLGEDDLQVATARNDLGRTLLGLGRLEEAAELHQRALATQEAVLSEDHLEVATTLEHLALVLMDQARHEEAESLLRRTLALREGALEPGHPMLASALAHLAIVLNNRHKGDEAERLYRGSLAMSRQRLGENHPGTARCWHNLGIYLVTTGESEKGEESLRRALSILEEVLGPKHYQTAIARAGLGIALLKQQRMEESLEAFLEAMEVLQQDTVGDRLTYAYVVHNYGRLLLSMGNLDAAEIRLEEVLTVRRQMLAPDHWMIAEVQGTLGVCLARQGHLEEAVPLLEKARPGVLKRFGHEDWRIQSIDATLEMARSRIR